MRRKCEVIGSGHHIRRSFCVTYMGSIGYMMSGAGINACWETVYAGNSVAHTMTGHAYSRDVVAHLFTTA